MVNKFFMPLMAAGMLMIYANTALSEIVVQDANATWDRSLSTISSPEILPRIIVEYSTTFTDIDFIFPTDLLLSASHAKPRIVVEYATTMPQFDLVIPPCKGDFDIDGDVDGLDLLNFGGDLDRLPIIIFGLSYGRNNCSE